MDNQLLDNSKCCSEQNLMMTFKSRAPLELHTRHMVIVSAIDEETLTCCVQLLSLQTNLEQLMIQINNCKKYHFDEIPINGSTCIGMDFFPFYINLVSLCCPKYFFSKMLLEVAAKSY